MLHGIATSTDATINWGDAFGSTLIDSTGASDALLDSSIYQIQLGAFEGPGGESFTPDGDNLLEWDSNWKVFDEAQFNDTFGYFTGGHESGSIMSGDDGTSQSPDATAGFDFSNQEAYIWIFNGKTLSESTEWFLGRVSTWIFPDAANFVECCGPDYDQEWSLSSDDAIGSVEIVFGGYKDYAHEGAGSHDEAEIPFLIQTYTIVPELSTLVQSIAMVGVPLFYMVARRKKGKYS